MSACVVEFHNCDRIRNVTEDIQFIKVNHFQCVLLINCMCDCTAQFVIMIATSRYKLWFL